MNKSLFLLAFVTVTVIATLNLVSCAPKDGSKTQSSAAAKQSTSNIDSEIPGIIYDFSSHWLQPSLLMIDRHPATKRVKLYYSIDNDIDISPTDKKIVLGSSPHFELQQAEATEFVEKISAHLPKTHRPYRPVENIEHGAIKLMLRGQLMVTQEDEVGRIVKASQVQTAKLIDALYTSGKGDANEIQDFGASVLSDAVQFRVWAPTARNVQVLLFDEKKNALENQNLEMTLNSNTGAWTARGPKALRHAYYQYRIKVYHPATDKIETLVTTDPYSLSLSVNSLYSQVVDLSQQDTKPEGWDQQTVPSLEKYEDSIFYETHIRDFSAAETNLSNANHRGKYKAFSETDSKGVQHLRSLRDAGVTHVHLLPAFDIATVDEDPLNRVALDDTVKKLCVMRPSLSLCGQAELSSKTLRSVLRSYAPSSGDAQALVESIRHIDDYNWGYDPYHYTVPEGSYATNPEGINRIIEFREMVQTLHGMGFRVVMDVVYNHTHSNEETAGRLHEYAVLDKLVPNYYNRLHPVSGSIENSTCCANTASEHAMMGKLMVDSLEVWTEHYKIDGFRFDLMGHQPKTLMLEAFERVKKIDPDNYFYGEGWNFGEVANNALFVQATQQELAGTEIGTFSDRLRDAVRGPGFNVGESIRKAQGVGNGLYLFPNERRPASADARSELLLKLDQIRVGLAGNLANFPLVNASGESVVGKDIPYGDAPTGYALDPADTINYVSKHDNQTLWDNHQYRLPFEATTDERVRLHLLSLAYPIFAQGIPFIHMGSELLRSKSFLRDSYDYGDWFNRVDFGMKASNYNVGLPPENKDSDKWAIIAELLQNNDARDTPTESDIKRAAAIFQEYIAIRSSSPLFRLGDASSIIERLSFLNTGPDQKLGIIAMQLNDEGFDQTLDPRYAGIVVLFNNSPEPQDFQHKQASRYALHPVQANGSDKKVRTQTVVNSDSIRVPAFSTAVLVKNRN